MSTLRRSKRNTYLCGCEAYIYDQDGFLQARDILRKSTENDLEAFRKALEQHDGLCLSMLLYALQNQPHSSVIKIIMDRILAEGKQSHEWMVCALHLACHWDNDIETIKLIMNTTTYGLNFVYCNQDWGPLHEAAAKGNLDLVNLLLTNGANIHIKTSHYGYTALHVAAKRGRLECVKFLVAAGADPAARNNEGKTPLECAPKTNYAMKTFLHPLSPIPKQKRTKGNIANNQKTKSHNNSSKSNPDSTLSSNLNENNNNYTKTNNTSLHKRKVVDIIDLIETEKAIKTEENTSSAACSKRQPDQQVNYNHNLNSSTEFKRLKLPTTSATTTTTTTTSLQNIQNVPVSTAANASLPSAPAVAPATTASSVPTPTLVQPPIPLLPTVPPGIPNNSQIKKIRVKRRGADGESWYVRVPAGCTRERLLELIQAKTGFACTVVLDERNVRIADTDDVNDLANDCELTIY